MTLTSTDTCALKQLTCSLAGAQIGGATVAGGSVRFAVTRPGNTTISYRATDSAGNIEVTKTLPIFVGGLGGGLVGSVSGLGLSCAAAPSMSNLPLHGPVSLKGKVAITDARTLKVTSLPFSFTFSY